MYHPIFFKRRIIKSKIPKNTFLYNPLISLNIVEYFISYHTCIIYILYHVKNMNARLL